MQRTFWVVETETDGSNMKIIGIRHRESDADRASREAFVRFWDNSVDQKAKEFAYVEVTRIVPVASEDFVHHIGE